MIITKLYIDNVFNFSNTTLDLTIKKLVTNSTIENEYIEDRENFRYKRVCIISGANATGKTSIGKIIMSLQNFLTNPLGYDIEKGFRKYVFNKLKPAEVTIEFVTPSDSKIHNVTIKLKASTFETSDKGKAVRHDGTSLHDGTKRHGSDSQIEIHYASTKIGVSMSATKAREKLDSIISAQKAPRGSVYQVIGKTSKLGADLDIFKAHLDKSYLAGTTGWTYLLSGNIDTSNSEKNKLNRIDVLNAILKTFDTSITDVVESFEVSGANSETTAKVKNGYAIKFSNGDTLLIDMNGNVTDEERLSKGTFDALKVVGFITKIISHKINCEFIYGAGVTYFLDEKMAFAHSELEQAIVNLIIDKLPKHSQFFYTTHNYDILDMSLPVHSYVFLKKVKAASVFVHPEEVFNKNDRSLLNYVKNDIFSTLPDTSQIDDLMLSE